MASVVSASSFFAIGTHRPVRKCIGILLSSRFRSCSSVIVSRNTSANTIAHILYTTSQIPVVSGRLPFLIPRIIRITLVFKGRHLVCDRSTFHWFKMLLLLLLLRSIHKKKTSNSSYFNEKPRNVWLFLCLLCHVCLGPVDKCVMFKFSRTRLFGGNENKDERDN